MTWVALDDDFHANPKIVSVGNAGAGLYVRALAYCAAYLTDGFVTREWGYEVGGNTLCKKLTTVKLWLSVSGGESFEYTMDEGKYTVEIPAPGFFIPEYLVFNPTRTHIEKQRSELSAKRREAGKRGAEARWGHGKQNGKPSGKAHGKPIAKLLDANGKTVAKP